MDDERNQMLRMLEELRNECTDEERYCDSCALSEYCSAEEPSALDNSQLMRIVEKVMW